MSQQSAGALENLKTQRNQRPPHKDRISGERECLDNQGKEAEANSGLRSGHPELEYLMPINRSRAWSEAQLHANHACLFFKVSKAGRASSVASASLTFGSRKFNLQYLSESVGSG